MNEGIVLTGFYTGQAVRLDKEGRQKGYTVGVVRGIDFDRVFVSSVPPNCTFGDAVRLSVRPFASPDGKLCMMGEFLDD